MHVEVVIIRTWSFSIVGHAFLVLGLVFKYTFTVIALALCPFYQSRFKFPAIFVVYEMFPLGLFSLFVLIGHMDRTKLFCSSQNLADSIANSTVFCNLQGLLYF